MELIYKGLELLGKGITWAVTKAGEVVVWLTEAGLKAIGTGIIELLKQLSGCNEIFIIVGIVGMFIIMSGRKELGTKITSGTFLTYIISRGVNSLC